MKFLTLILLCLSILNFYCPILERGRFEGYEWHLSNYDIVRTAVYEKHELALWDENAFPIFGRDLKNSLANPLSPALSPMQWVFLFGVSADNYIRWLIVGYGIIGVIGMYILLLNTGVSYYVASVFTILFTHCSWIPAQLSVGHREMIGIALLPVVILSLTKHYLILGGGAIALSALEGFQHVPVWLVLFGSAYALSWTIIDRDLKIFYKWFVMLLIAFILGSAKFIPMIVEHKNYIAANGPPGFTLCTLITSLTHEGQSVYWTIVTDWGWWEYSAYIGPVGLGLLIVGILFAGTYQLAFCGLGLVGLGIALYPPVLEWLQQFPVWQSERCPARYIIIALFAFCVYAAQGWTRLLDKDIYNLKILFVIISVLLSVWLSNNLATQAKGWI